MSDGRASFLAVVAISFFLIAITMLFMQIFVLD